MAGPATHIKYISDDGNNYTVLVPDWAQTFVGDAASAGDPGLPKGYQRRHRFLKGDTTNREYKITVGDVTKTAWTANIGAAVVGPPTIPGALDTAFHYGGRVGERDLQRG